MFRLLFAGLSLLAGLLLSLEEANCLNVDDVVITTKICYKRNSRNTCFTTFIAKDSQLVHKPFEAARHLCNSAVPDSSLIRINSLEDQRTVEMFLGRHELANETIIIDAQRLSTSDSSEWSWVNGHPILPKNFNNKTKTGLDGACVQQSKDGQSLGYSYCTGNQLARYRYICEYSGAKPVLSYRQNNSYYFASEGIATWYDARNECLGKGGDLASITDLSAIWNLSWLNKNLTYWIGLHRNKWTWNSTGAALTYTNWKGRHFNESYSNNPCVCIEPPQCRKENNGTIFCDRKWSNCSCHQNNYAIVCQKEEKITTSTTQKTPNHVPGNQLNVAASSSTGLFNSFTLTEVLLVLVLFLMTVLIVFAVVVVIRKFKKATRNEKQFLKIDQHEASSPRYETKVTDKGPSADIFHIYSELELTQQPIPSNDDVYDNIQPCDEMVDVDINAVYADTKDV